jgi:hypothetical protein
VYCPHLSCSLQKGLLPYSPTSLHPTALYYCTSALYYCTSPTYTLLHCASTLGWLTYSMDLPQIFPQDVPIQEAPQNFPQDGPLQEIPPPNFPLQEAPPQNIPLQPAPPNPIDQLTEAVANLIAVSTLHLANNVSGMSRPIPASGVDA